MTHQEMLDQVSDELRNKTVYDKITRWLNISSIELATQFVFGHLHTYGSVSTVASTPDVTLASNFLWPKSFQIPATQTKLSPKDEQEISEEHPDYRTLEGSVDYYYLNGITLGLFMVPTGVEIITYSYQRKPQTLTYPTIYYNSDLPEEWHELICQKAITKGYAYEGNSEGIVRSQNQETRLLIRLGASAYKRPDESLILGESTLKTRPPHPSFPTNIVIP